MFRDVRDSAAILAAKAQTLDQAQEEQQHARQGTDLGVARDDADECRRQTHAAQRNQERVLAAHDVADTTEQECAKWADQEPGREGPDVLDESGPRGSCREKLRRE